MLDFIFTFRCIRTKHRRRVSAPASHGRILGNPHTKGFSLQSQHRPSISARLRGDASPICSDDPTAFEEP